MSVVERALQKAREARQAVTEAVADGAAAKEAVDSRPISASAPTGGQGPTLVLDREGLRAMGLLPPVEEERRLASQYRKIKRPLIANAIGRGVERLPNGCLIMLRSEERRVGKERRSR